MEDLISPRTRRAFADYLSAYSTLAQIAGYFDDERVIKGPEQELGGPISGSRRSLTYEYYSTVRWDNPTDVTKVLRVYEAILDDARTQALPWNTPDQDPENRLRGMLVRDGIVVEGPRLMLSPNITKQYQVPGKELLSSADLLNERVLKRHIKQIEDSIEDDPDSAIGASKELIETTCKSILDGLGVSYQASDDVPVLVRRVGKELQLTPKDIPDYVKGADVVRVLLSNLAAIANQAAQLRNLYGSGHGRGAKHSSLKPRHARLAVGAATTLATFLVETYQDRSGLD